MDVATNNNQEQTLAFLWREHLSKLIPKQRLTNRDLVRILGIEHELSCDKTLSLLDIAKKIDARVSLDTSEKEICIQAASAYLGGENLSLSLLTATSQKTGQNLRSDLNPNVVQLLFIGMVLDWCLDILPDFGKKIKNPEERAKFLLAFVGANFDNFLSGSHNLIIPNCSAATTSQQRNFILSIARHHYEKYYPSSASQIDSDSRIPAQPKFPSAINVTPPIQISPSPLGEGRGGALLKPPPSLPLKGEEIYQPRRIFNWHYPKGRLPKFATVAAAALLTVTISLFTLGRNNSSRQPINASNGAGTRIYDVIVRLKATDGVMSGLIQSDREFTSSLRKLAGDKKTKPERGSR